MCQMVISSALSSFEYVRADHESTLTVNGVDGRSE